MTLPLLPSPRLPRLRLEEILATLTGVQVVWYTRKRPAFRERPFAERARILATAQSYQAIGVDELRQLYNPTSGKNDNLLVGQRKFTLVVTAESLDPSLEAFDLCERVRIGFRRQTARRLMVPTLALIDFGPVVSHDDATVEVGGVARTLLRATLDVRMATVVAVDPIDPGEGDWIETVDPVVAAVGGGGTTTGNV